MLKAKSLRSRIVDVYHVVCGRRGSGRVEGRLRQYPANFPRCAGCPKAGKKIEGEFSKRDQDLQRMAKQLQALQENLEKNAVTMAETERRTKEKEFNELSREFQRDSANSAKI